MSPMMVGSAGVISVAFSTAKNAPDKSTAIMRNSFFEMPKPMKPPVGNDGDHGGRHRLTINK